MLFQPLMPVVEYIVAYDYILKELCINTDKPELQCDGTCYLSKQIAKEMGNNTDNPFQHKRVKTELPQIIQELPEFTLFVSPASPKKNKVYQNPFHSSSFIFKTIKPPRAAKA